MYVFPVKFSETSCKLINDLSRTSWHWQDRTQTDRDLTTCFPQVQNELNFGDGLFLLSTEGFLTSMRLPENRHLEVVVQQECRYAVTRVNAGVNFHRAPE